MAAHTVELNETNFEQTIKEKPIVLVDFWAEWCAPCRAFAPVFDAAAAKNPDIVFGKVDTDAQPSLAQAFEIQGIPAIAVFRDTILLYLQSGALPASALDSVITQVRALDMNEVRKKIAAAEALQKN